MSSVARSFKKKFSYIIKNQAKPVNVNASCLKFTLVKPCVLRKKPTSVLKPEIVKPAFSYISRTGRPR